MHYMPEAYSNSLVPIERPRCPKCQTRMSLARIASGPKDSDVHTFECSKCQHVHIATVEPDPMKSAKAGWQYSELKPPK
jgi:hypothetical protein